MPRTKGSRNKKKLATDRQIQAMREEGTDPKDYITSCMKDPTNFDPIRFKAAETLMEYTHAKLSRTTLDGKLDIFKHEQALKELE